MTGLSALANASATFTVAATGVVTDPTTGNVTPTAESVTVQLFLKSDRVRGSAFPGVEIAETVFDGYALDKLDERIVIGTSGTINFAGEGVWDCEVTGLRLPYGKTGLLGATLRTALGDRIQLVTREQVG
jgi:hypothetical protein